MKRQPLFNKINREVLKKDLLNETFERVTVSFYKYFEIQSPSIFRDDLYKKFDRLKIFGRVYIAKEGINAQISVPTYNWNAFKKKLRKIKENFCLAPFFKRADLIAIPKSSLLEDIFYLSINIQITL